jgi:hypothetical protein
VASSYTLGGLFTNLGNAFSATVANDDFYNANATDFRLTGDEGVKIHIDVGVEGNA